MTKEIVLSFLKGEHTHIHPEQVLKDCSWEIAGQKIGQAPHSIYKILNHILFWQDLYLKRMAGSEIKSPQSPSGGWPETSKPLSKDRWMIKKQEFHLGLERAISIAKNRDLDERILSFRNSTLGECLVYLALHNSHHLGQIITMRQALGEWPAPKDEWFV